MQYSHNLISYSHSKCGCKWHFIFEPCPTVQTTFKNSVLVFSYFRLHPISPDSFQIFVACERAGKYQLIARKAVLNAPPV